MASVARTSETLTEVLSVETETTGPIGGATTALDMDKTAHRDLIKIDLLVTTETGQIVASGTETTTVRGLMATDRDMDRTVHQDPTKIGPRERTQTEDFAIETTIGLARRVIARDMDKTARRGLIKIVRRVKTEIGVSGTETTTVLVPTATARDMDKTVRRGPTRTGRQEKTATDLLTVSLDRHFANLQSQTGPVLGQRSREMTLEGRIKGVGHLDPEGLGPTGQNANLKMNKTGRCALAGDILWTPI